MTPRPCFLAIAAAAAPVVVALSGPGPAPAPDAATGHVPDPGYGVPATARDAAPLSWSPDPRQNTLVATGADEQVQPKLGATSDGGMYVSWFDNAAGGYDVALQLLDARGRPRWPGNGIIVADRNYSWTMDYGLAVDPADNAYLIFRDDRSGRDEVTVAKVTPGGDPGWGATGRQLPRSSPDVFTPSIAVASDARVWAAWTDGLEAKVLKLDDEGQPAFDRPVVFADPAAAQLTASDIRPGDDGSVIVAWVRQADMSAPRHLYAQKLSPTGEPLWGEPGDAPGSREPVTIFDTGSLQMGNFPDFVPDGAGGAVFAWYEVEPKLVHVQWVRADGSATFAPGGIVAAERAPNEEHVEPAVAFNERTQEIFVIWRLTYDSGPTYRMGLLAQKLSSDGIRQWGDGGLAFSPPGPTEMTQANALPVGDGVMFAVVDALTYGNQQIRVRRLDGDGADVWAPAETSVSIAPSAKARLTGAWSRSGFVVFAWEDSRAGGPQSADIYAQSVGENGELVPIIADPELAYLPRLQCAGK